MNKIFFIKKTIIKFTTKGGIPRGKCIKHTINYSAYQRKTPKTEKTLIIILS